MQQKYPSPKRTGHKVRLEKDDDGIIDIGWSEGTLNDGRPYRAELWAQDQITVLTFFFSAIGLEQLDQGAITEMLRAEKLVIFADSVPSIGAARFRDASGNTFCSVNIVVGDEDCTYLTSSVFITRYPAS